MVFFVIQGEPKGKGRPKFNRRTKSKRFAYTPKATKTYESLVREEYKKQIGNFKFPKDTPLEIKVYAFLKIPKNESKAKRLKMSAGKILPTKRPDTDNVIKIITDALNGIAYDDDKQVTDPSGKKRYAEVPGVMVIIKEVETGNESMGIAF